MLYKVMQFVARAKALALVVLAKVVELLAKLMELAKKAVDFLK